MTCPPVVAITVYQQMF